MSLWLYVSPNSFADQLAHTSPLETHLRAFNYRCAIDEDDGRNGVGMVFVVRCMSAIANGFCGLFLEGMQLQKRP